MRVVPLDRPWKEHQRLYVLNFLISLLNIWKDFKILSRFIQIESNLLLVRITVYIESFLPIGWRTFVWWKNPPKCCTILVWIAGWWNSLLTSCKTKTNCWLSRIFGDRFGGKDCGLWPYNPSQQVGGLDAFLYEAAQNFEVFSKIQDQKIKKSKIYSGWCPFPGLSNGTTLMQIQSGRTVPLKLFCTCEWPYRTCVQSLAHEDGPASEQPAGTGRSDLAPHSCTYEWSYLCAMSSPWRWASPCTACRNRAFWSSAAFLYFPSTNSL